MVVGNVAFNNQNFEVHLKKIILFYLLVIVCCDVGVTAHQPSAKLRQQDGVRKLDRNEGILSEIVLKFYSLKN